LAIYQSKDLAKLESAAKDPTKLFRGRINEFSAFDSDGIPIRDSKDVELTPSARKVSLSSDLQVLV
jgi:hypothetical protein